MLHDKWSLNGIGAGILGSRIGRHINLIECITAGNGLRLGALLHMHRVLIQRNELDAIPERTPGKPRLALLIYHEIRIDGIPIHLSSL